MSESFTKDLRERFRKLLLLSAESPYEGERTAALEAAERLAARCGMTLEEAARMGFDQPRQEPPPQSNWSEREAASAWTGMSFSEDFYSAAASRARQAHREKVAAEQRAEEERRQELRRRGGGGTRSGRRLPPRVFARILLQETSLSIREIEEITGLDVYEVVGLKLKLRNDGLVARAS